MDNRNDDDGRTMCAWRVADGQRAVSRAEHDDVAAKRLSARLTSAADSGTAAVPVPQQSSSSRQSSCIVEESTFDFHHDDDDDAVTCLEGCVGVAGTGGRCCSLTTADCCARLPPAMLVCNRSRLKSYRAADRRSCGRYRSRSTVVVVVVVVVGRGGVLFCTAAGCWPSNRFFDS